MADVKQIEVNGITYDIHDAVAREEIASLRDSVSPETTWKTFADGCTYKKVGDICFVNFQMEGMSQTSTFRLGTLPSGYRPAQSFRQNLINQGGTNFFSVAIGRDGVVQMLARGTGGGSAFGLIAFPVK